MSIACTDLLRRSVNPIVTITPKNSFLEIEKQILSEGPVKAVVIGWPLTPQGDPTHATPLASDFYKKLKMKYSELDIFMFDVRLSPVKALRLTVDYGGPYKDK